MRPFQFHIAAMAVFASIIAPFGGFFASGFKRAFKIKDFGDMIPGHGGLMGMLSPKNFCMWRLFDFFSESQD